MLEIIDLHANIEDKEILKGLTLKINKGLKTIKKEDI